MRNVLWVSPMIGLALAGCNTVRTPIVALAADDVGVVASLSPQTQGGALTVGYKGAKYAILPVESSRGDLLAIRTAGGVETYSIFTQLGVDVKSGTTRGVAVAQVLAVGPAADAWVARADAWPVPLTQPATSSGQR